LANSELQGRLAHESDSAAAATKRVREVQAELASSQKGLEDARRQARAATSALEKELSKDRERLRLCELRNLELAKLLAKQSDAECTESPSKPHYPRVPVTTPAAEPAEDMARCASEGKLVGSLLFQQSSVNPIDETQLSRPQRKKSPSRVSSLDVPRPWRESRKRPSSAPRSFRSKPDPYFLKQVNFRWRGRHIGPDQPLENLDHEPAQRTIMDFMRKHDSSSRSHSPPSPKGRAPPDAMLGVPSALSTLSEVPVIEQSFTGPASAKDRESCEHGELAKCAISQGTPSPSTSLP